jgi:hypothetical protein
MVDETKHPRDGGSLIPLKGRQRAADVSGVLIALLTLMISNFTCAKEFIECDAPNIHDAVITIDAKEECGRALNCISGEFVSDLTPCAPNGGYGISAGTGSAPLVGIVGRWQDLSNHIGGVTESYVDDTRIYFWAGFAPDLTESWSFTVNRLTGKAQLQWKRDVYDRPINKTITFVCKKTKPRL